MNTKTYTDQTKYDNENEANKMLQDHIDETKGKEPIYRECPNMGNSCFCPGTCKQIVGWQDKRKHEFLSVGCEPFLM